MDEKRIMTYIKLHDNGRSYADIARAFGIKPQTVWSQVYRWRKRRPVEEGKD